MGFLYLGDDKFSKSSWENPEAGPLVYANKTDALVKKQK